MVIIIGAGLSGLLIAYRLQQQGIAYSILESRERVGGRIHTVCGANNSPVEMGATWFGTQHTALLALLEELSIGQFEQFMTGTSFFQPFSTTPAQAVTIPSDPPSYRIAGGSSTLIHALHQQLDTASIHLQQLVTSVELDEKLVRVVTQNKTYTGQQLVLALPPKLWAQTISFEPQLSEALLTTAQTTQTWMEDSIKAAVIYEQPFWRQQAYSGILFSNTGPIAEFYDHCNVEVSTYALGGFIKPTFANLTQERRKEQVLQQLAAIFGTAALLPLEYIETIWSEEQATFSPSPFPLFPHQNNGHALYQQTWHEDQLFIAGTESSPHFSGYMEGAIRSAYRTAHQIITINKP